MKLSVESAVLLILCSVSTLAKHHVFLIAGQSNAVGYNSDGFTDEDISDPRIHQLSCCKDGNLMPVSECKFITAQDPLHHKCSLNFVNGKTIGFGMSFARQLLPTLPTNDHIILVPAAISGTGFADNVWTAYTGSGFKSAVARLNQTMNLLTSQGFDPGFEGILWLQGEHDAGDNSAGNVADTEFYLYSDIIPMIEAFRDRNLLPFPSDSVVPFVCGNLLPSWATNSLQPQRYGVWNALALLHQYVPYTACAPSQGLLGDPVYLSGLNQEIIHFTGRSERILGKRLFVSWLLAKLNGSE